MAHSVTKIDLVCPAGSLPALKTAVDNGADCVYLGFRDATNARNFAGLNFDDIAIAEGIHYAHAKGRKVMVALNTYPQPTNLKLWRSAIDRAARLGVDAVFLADLGLMEYAVTTYPALQLHLSVQGSATNYEAINFYHERFGITRAVLPRVLSLAQVEHVLKNTSVEIEVFGFGSLCVMVEGRCALSSYVTGEAPNTHGVCSPAKAVRWEQTPKGLESRLNGILIDRYADGENASYPTLCKGRCLANKVPFIAGPDLNLFNTCSLKLIARLGAKRWVMPLELGRESLTYMTQDIPAGLETEIFGYGRLPLAYSARCFTARHHNLPKDDCRFSCIDYPDGLLLQTRENQPFLVLNGIQTQSSKVYNLINEIQSMKDIGVDLVRISPQAQHTERVINLFDETIRQQVTAAEAFEVTKKWMPDQPCNGYWHGKPGLEQTVS